MQHSTWEPQAREIAVEVYQFTATLPTDEALTVEIRKTTVDLVSTLPRDRVEEVLGRAMRLEYQLELAQELLREGLISVVIPSKEEVPAALALEKVRALIAKLA